MELQQYILVCPIAISLRTLEDILAICHIIIGVTIIFQEQVQVKPAATDKEDFHDVQYAT